MSARQMMGMRLHTADEVPLFRSAALTLCLMTVGFGVVLGPARQTSIGRVLFDCSWLGWLIPFLGMWALTLLGFKYATIVSRRRLLRQDLLPRELSESITSGTAPTFLRYLQSRFGDLSRDPLLRRMEGALQRLSTGQSTREAVSELQDQARLDADQASIGYTMVRAFLWALPILGFIGTCIGIGSAISGFADTLDKADSIDTIKASLKHVVTGLAFAFNATLMGLFTSLAVVFPMSALQRAEHAFFAAVDQYCAVHFTRRLRDDGAREASTTKSPTDAEPV